MLISLRSDHKEHLLFLAKQPNPVVVDFCKLALDFLQNGSNLKRYKIAAQKLDVEPDVVQNCIFGIINLLVLSCKHKLNEADFRDSVLTLGFSQEQQIVLSKFYGSKKSDICTLHHTGINELHYDNLKWRFEVQVSSRSLLQQITPLISMELSLKKRNEEDMCIHKENILVQTDPHNLLHIANELENALNESRSRHSRKIQRALRN